MEKSRFLNSCAAIFTVALLSFQTVPNADAAADPVILARQYTTNIVHIAGGTFTTPYIITIPNTEYILDGDITANGVAFAIRASKVVLNLNGKSVTYNQITPGEGVFIDTYNLTDIAITNGSLLQGAAMSEGDVYGQGNNPVRAVGVARVQIASIYARYGGRDVGGFYMPAGSCLIEQNTLDDVWTVGTLKNRDQGVDAITMGNSGNNIFRNNTIKNCRQRGINATGTNDEVYGNVISINSMATNSYGIFGYAAQHVKVHDNTVTGMGEHPIGIGFVAGGTNDIQIYNNVIDVQTTRLGAEYGGSASCFNSATPCGNYAVGFRTTWGGNNINFHDNSITIHSDASYQGTYSPTGQSVLVNGKGRGLMVAVNLGEKSQFSNNSITTLDKDGTGKAFGIACTGNNAGDLTFDGNTVTSNILNVALSDEYGYCAGYPLFLKNTFVQAGSYPGYRTIGAELNGYFEGTGRFISNAYQGGAAENKLDLNFQYPNTNKSVIFGRLMEATVTDASGALLPNTSLNTYNGSNALQTQAVTGADGKTLFMVYDYELNNNTGLTQSSTPITVVFRPHVLELYNTALSQSLFKSQLDTSSTAWDALTSSGLYSLGDSAGYKIAISTTASAFVPPTADTTAPGVTVSSPVSATKLAGVVTVSVAATDNVAVTKVELYVNGVLLAADPAPAPFNFTWNTALVGNGSYTLMAKAYDAAGNVGQSAATVVTVNNPQPDTTAPTVSLTAPANNSTVAGKITVSATATDAGGISRVEFSLDGALQAAVNAAPYGYTLDTTTLTNGSHLLLAKAYDVAGNQGQASLTLLVNNSSALDTSAPTVAISSPVSKAVLSGAVTLSAAASDNVAVTKVEFYLNSTLLATVSKAPFSYSLNTNSYWNYPSCVLTAKAYDAAGNVGQAAVMVAILNDTTAPVISSFSLPSAAASTRVAVSSFTATDNVGVTGYFLSESSTVPAASAAGWSTLAPTSLTFAGTGSRTAHAWVKDAKGNVSAGKTASVVIDTTLPVIGSLTLGTGAATVTVKATATDNVAVTKMQLFVDGILQQTTASGSLSYIWTVTFKGTHTITVNAFDAAGNTRSNSVSIVK